MIPITTFAGKDVAVFGLGASGNATAAALIAGGATVAAWDDTEPGRASAAAAGVPLVDLAEADWSRFSALVLAPGVPLTHPEPHWVVKRAQEAGVEVIGDIELFCRERRARCPETNFIAITGTNGKSTTTALIAHILKEAGHDVQLGGNIGRAILTLDDVTPERIYVVECSSFQIDLAPTLDPTVGVLLNITPDHLDRHGTIENYANVKSRLVEGARTSVIGIDRARHDAGDLSGAIFHRLDHDRGNVTAFTRTPSDVTGYTYHEQGFLKRAVTLGLIGAYVEVLADLKGARALRGAHNAENAAAAFLACEWIGTPHDVIGRGLASFPGLVHRLEEIGRMGNVVFVNDSKATNAESTKKALASWDRGIHVILGGKAKDGGIEALRPWFPRIEKAYLIGAASRDFARSLGSVVPFEECGTLDVAVARATRDALAANNEDRVVLLSPACASYDQYKNFEQRGDHFRALVARELAAHTGEKGGP
ncbi:MAG: UDP-N-acetylmuramoyl-L-alanine--D-glutamate ligase [Hyphomicrobium sp.]|nr:UDP-N-acetylmuramoyl-L-alanine--D-glutamate ligase [Hyphomicrobium sp.]